MPTGKNPLGPSGETSKAFEAAHRGFESERELVKHLRGQLKGDAKEQAKDLAEAERNAVLAARKSQSQRWEDEVRAEMKPTLDHTPPWMPKAAVSRQQAESIVDKRHRKEIGVIRQDFREREEGLLREAGFGPVIDAFRDGRPPNTR